MRATIIILALANLSFFQSLSAQPVLDFQPFASGLSQPVDIVHAGDERLFILEKAGRIRILDAAGNLQAEPFLDIVDRVRSSGSEQGLLGLAFHPDYAENGFFYVNYTNREGDTHISRFQVSAGNPDQANRTSERVLLEVAQPYSNHNGGDLAFGPDGYLYIGLGDGGSGGDPQNFAQNRQSLLGKMLRIDVDNGDPYAIPPDNPFAETDETLDEIWALGLRNPWRFSFDRLTGDLWTADVGQNAWEEVNFQPADSEGGENYGWRCYEGNADFNTGGCPAASQLTFPVHVYPHGGPGCRSVTGGYVYRGDDFPNMQGYYIYADFCTGEVWGLLSEVEDDFVNVVLYDFDPSEIVSFGEDQNGELYVAAFQKGIIYRIVDQCAAVEAPEIAFAEDILSVPDTFATYQWLLDEEPIQGETGPELIPTSSGAFSIEVSTEEGCEVTSEPFLITAVPGAIGVRWWQVLPNPFRDQLNLEMELTEPAAFQVKIYDTSGRLVFSDRLERNVRWLRQYQLGELPSGLYFLSLERGKQQIVEKLLKTE
jgi:glucose/arabinose dehydrogenase